MEQVFVNLQFSRVSVYWASESSSGTFDLKQGEHKVVSSAEGVRFRWSTDHIESPDKHMEDAVRASEAIEFGYPPGHIGQPPLLRAPLEGGVDIVAASDYWLYTLASTRYPPTAYSVPRCAQFTVQTNRGNFRLRSNTVGYSSGYIKFSNAFTYAKVISAAPAMSAAPFGADRTDLVNMFKAGPIWVTYNSADVLVYVRYRLWNAYEVRTTDFVVSPGNNVHDSVDDFPNGVIESAHVDDLKTYPLSKDEYPYRSLRLDDASR